MWRAFSHCGPQPPAERVCAVVYVDTYRSGPQPFRELEEYQVFRWTEHHLLLAALRRSPIHHVFVVSDLRSSKSVHIDQDGCRILGKDSVVEVDMTLADTVTASMRFPGYVNSRHLPLEVDGQMLDGQVLELVDGGLYDNLALSVYADIDPGIATIISIDASVAKPASRPPPRHFIRIRLLARAISDLHRRTSEAYLALRHEAW